VTSIINGANGKQDYGTPRAFLDACEERFGRIGLDLAAHAGNHAASDYLSSEDDSFQHRWSDYAEFGVMWLNPPFGRIAPWAAKCADEASRGARILFLVPASVGCVWFWRHVHGKALVLPVTPRLTFDGSPANPKTGKPDPFPKDLMLCAYGWPPGFEQWRWRPEIPRKRRAA
jgi:phage N-6-adenine-methyltransferase